MTVVGRRLVLLGAGGHGKVAADVAEQAGWREVVFTDGGWPERVQNGPWPIVGADAALKRLLEDGWAGFISVGDNATRARLTDTLGLKATAPVLIHPMAAVSPHASIGAGTLIVAGAVVNPATVVGCGVILNTGATVDHDNHIGDFVHISPGAALAGGVTVGPRSWIGIGASVREGVAIGADARVGAGAAVVRDVPDGVTVAGVPARILSCKE